MSQALYQVRQEIKREKERELNGSGKKKMKGKELILDAAPMVAAPVTTKGKEKEYVRRPPAAPVVFQQTPVFARTKVTAELRAQMRQEMAKE